MEMNYTTSINTVKGEFESFLEMDDKIFDEMTDAVFQTIKESFAAVFNDLKYTLMMELESRLSTRELRVAAGLDDMATLEVVFEEIVGDHEDIHPRKKELLLAMKDTAQKSYADVIAFYEKGDANVEVKRLSADAQLPTYAHEGDQGADVYAVEDMTLAPHTYGNAIHTGIALKIPTGWSIAISARSGMSKKTTARISNGRGVIDTKYTGEIIVLMDNIGDEPVEIHKGDRIAQLILERNYRAIFSEVFTIEDDDAEDARNAGGFGSTGV